MPTYVYACRDCAERTELVQKMSDAPLSDCPNCGGSVRRVLFPPAVVFKGSGFYVTDYKNGGGKNGSPGEAAGTASPAPAADASADKPEAKTESTSSA